MSDELPLLPVGRWRLKSTDKPKFVTWFVDGDIKAWCLLGQDTDLPVGEVIEVEQFRTGEWQQVLVGKHLAERTVVHREGSRYGEGTVRYVIAEIDRGPNG